MSRRNIPEFMAHRSGDVYRLTNGTLVTSHTLYGIAKSKGSTVAESTLSRRLASGLRDFDSLIASAPAVKSANSAKGQVKRAAKKAADVEFLAAVAAVNARRNQRA